MLVTINTDASFHNNSKLGAYAFWAISNEFKITKSGVFKKPCNSSQDAEAKCIINALKVVLLAHKGISKIVINTDSLHSAIILQGGIRRPDTIKRWKSITKVYKELIGNFPNVKIEFRHVKAHSGTRDARSYVNEWCDRQAKKQLKNIIILNEHNFI